MTRIVLGSEAFLIYFGDNLFDWAVHSLTFASIPIAFGLPGSIPSDFTAVRYRTGLLVIRGLISYLQFVGVGIYAPSASMKNTFWTETWQLFPPPPCKIVSAWPMVKMVYRLGMRLIWLYGFERLLKDPSSLGCCR